MVSEVLANLTWGSVQGQHLRTCCSSDPVLLVIFGTPQQSQSPLALGLPGLYCVKSFLGPVYLVPRIQPLCLCTIPTWYIFIYNISKIFRWALKKWVFLYYWLNLSYLNIIWRQFSISKANIMKNKIGFWH